MAVLNEPEIRRKIDEARRKLDEGDLPYIVVTTSELSRLSTRLSVGARSGKYDALWLAAQEIARRFERALGKALRQGHTVEKFMEGLDRRRVLMIDGEVLTDVGNSYLSEAIYPLIDGVSDERFEACLAAGKADGDLGRDLLIGALHPGARTRRSRRLEKLGGTPEQRKARIYLPVDDQERLLRIATLAAEGNSSTQIAGIIGHDESYVRLLARNAGIIIPADEVTRMGRRFDPTRVIRQTVDTLAGLTVALDALDLRKVNFTEAAEWAASLDRSISKLIQLNQRISREATHS
jgi:hypothetical protein